jgi:uncharacterized phage protein (TIGR01671 family)
MRKIKFRAWDKQNNKFLPHIYQMGSGFPSPDYCYHFLQYTGLNDKNGKEVYEGDIIAWQHWVSSVRDGAVREVWENATVVFENGAFKANDIDFDISDSVYEVIGNIYEHPELLTPNPTT